MIIDILQTMTRSIWANKIRSFLTMLGVIIGVSSVVTLISIGEGVKEDVKKMVQGLGTNIIFILPGQIDSSGFSGGNASSFISGDILTNADAQAIAKLEGIEAVSPFNLLGGVIRRGEKTAAAESMGATEGIHRIFTAVSIAEGRQFDDAQDAGARVVIIGAGVKSELFAEGEEVLGQTLEIGRNGEFEIIGVLSESKETSALGGNELEQIVVVPFDTVSALSGREAVFRIGIKASDDFDTAKAVAAIRDDMQTRHQADEFSVLTQDDLLDLLGQFLNIATAMVSAIAAIALIVGGIGIMNIMLVSVTERTREIGIRKAVGATPIAILWQFLAEAMFISLLGGLFGLGLSYLATWAVMTYSPIVPVVTTSAIFLAISVSLTVGIVFGLAPAIRASRKDPIDALRFE